MISMVSPVVRSFSRMPLARRPLARPLRAPVAQPRALTRTLHQAPKSDLPRKILTGGKVVGGLFVGTIVGFGVVIPVVVDVMVRSIISLQFWTESKMQKAENRYYAFCRRRADNAKNNKG